MRISNASYEERGLTEPEGDRPFSGAGQKVGLSESAPARQYRPPRSYAAVVRNGRRKLPVSFQFDPRTHMSARLRPPRQSRHGLFIVRPTTEPASKGQWDAMLLLILTSF